MTDITKKKPMFLSIESFSKGDVSDLFDAICINILNISPSKAKQDILKLPGSQAELEKFKPSVQSLLTIVAVHDIKFEFKVMYMGVEVVKEVTEEAPAIDPIKKEMADQEKFIEKRADGEYIGGKKIEEVSVGPDGKLPDKDIPDFD